MAHNSTVNEAFLVEGFEIAMERVNSIGEIPKPLLVSLQQGIATHVCIVLDVGLRGKAPAFVKECEVADVLGYAKDEGRR